MEAGVGSRLVMGTLYNHSQAAEQAAKLAEEKLGRLARVDPHTQLSR
jgi:hypothetical protein